MYVYLYPVLCMIDVQLYDMSPTTSPVAGVGVNIKLHKSLDSISNHKPDL